MNIICCFLGHRLKFKNKVENEYICFTCLRCLKEKTFFYKKAL